MKLPRRRKIRPYPFVSTGMDSSFGVNRVLESQEDTTGNTEAKPEKKADAADETMIKCPKCAKMVNRARVVKRKYTCYVFRSI